MTNSASRKISVEIGAANTASWAWRSLAGRARRGQSRRVVARLSQLRQAKRCEARQGVAGLGKAGKAWLIVAVQGDARQKQAQFGAAWHSQSKQD